MAFIENFVNWAHIKDLRISDTVLIVLDELNGIGKFIWCLVDSLIIWDKERLIGEIFEHQKSSAVFRWAN